jgi:hypothetical protein
VENYEANKLLINEALRRLWPNPCLDRTLLQEQIAAVVKEQGETIFAQLSDEAREQLRREGYRMREEGARLTRINEAVEYGRSNVARYSAETLGDLPLEEQSEFARLWVSAVGGARPQEN